MADTTAPAANDGGPVSMAELIRCVDRELGFRARVYPRWVEKRKMTQAVAELEIRRLRAVRDRLVLADAEHTVMTGLAERLQMSVDELAFLVREAEAMSRAMYPVAGPV